MKMRSDKVTDGSLDGLTVRLYQRTRRFLSVEVEIAAEVETAAATVALESNCSSTAS